MIVVFLRWLKIMDLKELKYGLFIQKHRKSIYREEYEKKSNKQYNCETNAHRKTKHIRQYFN